MNEVELKPKDPKLLVRPAPLLKQPLTTPKAMGDVALTPGAGDPGRGLGQCH